MKDPAPQDQLAPTPTKRAWFNLPGNFATYFIIIFILTLGDALMSYATPVFLAENLHSDLLMGLMMSTSSVIGIITDFTVGQRLRAHRFGFFLRLAIIVQMTFPLVLFFGPTTWPFMVIAMGVWGIYYEFMGFSNFHYLDETAKRHQFALSWGLIMGAKSVAFTIGPILSSLLIAQSYQQLGLIVLIFSLIAMAVTTFGLRSRTNRLVMPAGPVTTTSLKTAFNIWRVLGKRLFLVLLFLFMLGLVDASFWTIGAVISERLSNTDGLLLVAYSAPSLVIATLTNRIAKPFGKKRAAFIAGFIAGIGLILTATATNEIALILSVLLVGSAIGVAWPMLYAVMEDYVDRLPNHNNEFIGLQLSMTSTAYIIGPILSGAVATYFGEMNVFLVVGVAIITIATVCMLFVPRKIKLPQAELTQLQMKIGKIR